MSKQECIRCVNDQTVKKIKFNEEGLCNFCQTFDEYENILNDYDKLEELFLKKIAPDDKSYDYDVALGISGGKDSTYVLYQLVKKYNLKVKTYTLDNGFLTIEAKQKINKIVKEFNVEHEYVVSDENLLKKIYKQITTKLLSPCIACSFLGYAVMINYASKVNARVGMHGRSFYQMFRNFASDVDDVFKPFIINGLKEDVDLDKMYQTIIEKIDLLVDKKLAKEIKEKLLSDALEKGYRDFIAYFLYHPYQIDDIITFLEENTSWKVQTEKEHFDCAIHNGALYLKNLKARRSHLMPEYSVMIRKHHLSKTQAKELMIVKQNITTSKKELKMFCKYTKTNYTLLLTKAKIYSKRWW